MNLSHADVVELLDLAPLPGEGGHFRQTFADGLSTAIYYLIGGEHFSALHRLTGPEVYHWYAGAPLDLFCLHPDGATQQVSLGPDIASGQQPQAAVAAGVWQGSRSAGQWTLIGTTMAPPFTEAGFELADERLAEEYPHAATQIRQLLPVEPSR